MTGFDYDRCLDKNKNFHTGKAKAYLKSIDIVADDEIIAYIKENKDIPMQSEEVDPEIEADGKEEIEETPQDEEKANAEERSPQDIVGFKKISPYGSRQCQFCKSFNRFEIVEEECEEPGEDGGVAVHQISVLIKTDDPSNPVFSCKKNPWSISKISTCRKFRRR